MPFNKTPETSGASERLLGQDSNYGAVTESQKKSTIKKSSTGAELCADVLGHASSFLSGKEQRELRIVSKKLRNAIQNQDGFLQFTFSRIVNRVLSAYPPSRNYDHRFFSGMLDALHTIQSSGILLKPVSQVTIDEAASFLAAAKEVEINTALLKLHSRLQVNCPSMGGETRENLKYVAFVMYALASLVMTAVGIALLPQTVGLYLMFFSIPGAIVGLMLFGCIAKCCEVAPFLGDKFSPHYLPPSNVVTHNIRAVTTLFANAKYDMRAANNDVRVVEIPDSEDPRSEGVSRAMK